MNNAAAVIMKQAEDSTSEDHSFLMGTNLESPFHLCQLAYPLLKASEVGNIVFMSSVAGGTALPGLSIYAATKGNPSQDLNAVDVECNSEIALSFT